MAPRACNTEAVINPMEVGPMTEDYKAPPDPEQQELPDDEGEIIDYYNALAAQHFGQCVFHAPTSEENFND